jgi:hypothetical protein
MSRTKRAARKRAGRLGKSSRNSPVSNKESLVRMLEWFLSDAGIFSNLKFHGNTSWLPKDLVWLALCWAWSESRNLTDGFTEAVGCCQVLSKSSALSTYQGFMGALTRWTSEFICLLCLLLQRRMEEIGGKFWRIGGWVPIAFDGSRSTAPRTKSNERAFCAANYGSGKTARYRKKKTKGLRRKKNEKNPAHPQEPQAWITLMWHMALRLPWMWRLGPSNSSERGHVIEMLHTGKFPINTLFCGDAGFVGYPLWAEILERGGQFLIRVGANVSLLAESADFRLLRKGLVLCWPKAMAATGRPPLRLRLVKVRIGKLRVCLLTSVLEPAKLPTKQIIQFYKMRWGIEVEFRGLKQTLDRAKLRSRNDQRLLVELDWSIMAMAVAELFALKEQLAKKTPATDRHRPPSDPAKRSLAQTIRALRQCLRNLNDTPEPGSNLPTLLAAAITDNYRRKAAKRARYRPPNPDKKPLGEPKLRKLTNQEKKKLQVLDENLAA